MPSRDNFSFQVQSILRCLDIYSVSRDDLIELLVAIKFNNHYGCIPESTHIKLVNLFCRSSGRIQEIIHAFRIKPVNHLLNSIVLESNLFKTTPAEFSQIIRDLNDNGYDLNNDCLVNTLTSEWYVDARLNGDQIIDYKFFDGYGYSVSGTSFPTQVNWLNALYDSLPPLRHRQRPGRF